MDRWEDEDAGAYWQFRALIDDALVSLAGRGVTARQIATDAGISEATLSKWRHGDRPGDRARVDRVSAAIATRLSEVGIDCAFLDDCERTVDAMFPVRLQAVPDAEPDVEPPSTVPDPKQRGRSRLWDVLWSIPLLHEIVFVLARYGAYRAGESRSPFDDGPSLSFGLLVGVSLAVLGPLVSNRDRYRRYLERWAADRALVAQLGFERASPPVSARVGMVVASTVLVVTVLVPDFLAEISLLGATSDLPSWAAPGVRPLLIVSLTIQVVVMLDLILLSMWRMVYWMQTVLALDRDARFEIQPGRSDGGWWPPLRAAYIAIFAISGLGIGYVQLGATRQIPVDEQPTMLVVRVVVGVLLVTALVLLHVLHRAHEHRPADVPEAALLNLSVVFAAILVVIVLAVLFSG